MAPEKTDMDSNNKSSGIGILGVLTLIFVVLKLAEVGAVARWSWFWVLSPTLIPWMILLGGLAVAYPAWAVASWFKRRAAMRDLMRD